MNIIVACKIVPDDQDIQVAADGSLDFSRAHEIVSTYDLNAIEAAAQLAAANEGSALKAISVGPKKADDSKTKKNILARGVDELFLAADDALDDLDAFATAAELAKLVEAAGGADLVVVGDGSADLYAKQTGAQLAAAMDVPYVSGAVSMEAAGGKLAVKRVLESVSETLEVPLPAVVAVSPDAALPRIAGMKDILAAGKKPMAVSAAAAGVPAAVETVSVKAPEQADRKQQIFEGDDVAAFAAAVKSAL
jgi:electron transfer flavoprotein beta subunit